MYKTVLCFIITNDAILRYLFKSITQQIIALVWPRHNGVL